MPNSASPTSSPLNVDLDGVTLHTLTDDLLAGVIVAPDGEMFDKFAKSSDGTAGHVSYEGGRAPYLMGSLPSGDIGALISWDPTLNPVHFEISQKPLSLIGALEDSSTHGFSDQFSLTTEQPLTARKSWTISLGAMRKVRALFEGGVPDLSATTISVNPQTLTMEQAIPGGYRGTLSLTLSSGSLSHEGDSIIFTPDNGMIAGTIALTTDHHRHPTFHLRDLFSPAEEIAIDDVFSYYLAWRENGLGFPTALLAGSPRFNNLFPRDFSHWLLAHGHRLSSPFKSDAFSALLFRISGDETASYEIGTSLVDDGELSHEDTVGEAAGNPYGFALDYKMIDTTYLLMPVIEKLVTSGEPFTDQLVNLLDTTDQHGISGREKLTRNLRRIYENARPFAESRNPDNLIAFKSDASVGAWRDSATGDFGTRRPMYVSMALVPAALSAGAFLLDHLSSHGEQLPNAPSVASLRALASAWQTATPSLFAVTLPYRQACESITEYCSHLGIPDTAPIASLEGKDLQFLSLGLRDDGTPVSVQSSDIAFLLSYTDPAPEVVHHAAHQIIRPFPAGLLIPEVGFAVAAPLDPDLMRDGLPHHYHGASVWSFQNYQLLIAFNRQERRTDLPPQTQELVTQACSQLRTTINQVAPFRHQEFWGWTYDQKADRFAPARVRERSNDPCRMQLWSTFGSAVR